jgi:Uma2 family endonuclease
VSDKSDGSDPTWPGRRPNLRQEEGADELVYGELPMTSRATKPASGGAASRVGQPTWDVALLFPAQGAWSEDEYLALHTNRLVEFDDGCLEVLPMPTLLHQMIVKLLFMRLEAFVTAQMTGTVLFAPLPVRLWPGKFREPDLVYLRPERVRNLRGQPEGADLAVEVVSEGEENRERDLDIKPKEYARAGISEYWIVDPETQRVIVLSLDGQTYREHGVFRVGDTAESVLLEGFQVEVSEIFAERQAASG